MGYPIVPISLAPEPEPEPAPALGDEAEEEEREDETFVTPAWEQAERLWRRLEASGLLEIERDEEALPVRARLISGGNSWRGRLPQSGDEMWPVEVVVFDSEPWTLLAQTAAPECGFCRFMKMGPCGAEFAAWEKCIEAARDTKADFVDLCGAQTMTLKQCTDKHPEYYGMLAGDADDEETEETSPPLPPPQEVDKSAGQAQGKHNGASAP